VGWGFHPTPCAAGDHEGDDAGSISLRTDSRASVARVAPRAPEAFATASHGLRARIERSLDDAVLIFELDRLLYDIEVDAQHEWLRRLMAFDAYCARRDGGGLGDDPVR
jgi:hypothetical protein